MKKTQKPETKKRQQGQKKEDLLNQELLKVEKAFATGLRAGPIITNNGSTCSVDNGGA